MNNNRTWSDDQSKWVSVGVVILLLALCLLGWREINRLSTAKDAPSIELSIKKDMEVPVEQAVVSESLPPLPVVEQGTGDATQEAKSIKSIKKVAPPASASQKQKAIKGKTGTKDKSNFSQSRKSQTASQIAPPRKVALLTPPGEVTTSVPPVGSPFEGSVQRGRILKTLEESRAMLQTLQQGGGL